MFPEYAAALLGTAVLHVSDARPVKDASRAHYEDLLDAGVELYEYQPTMMHTKVMVVDRTWSVFGSANFDNRSLEINDELNMSVQDAALATRLRDDFEIDLRQSQRMTLDAWRARPAATRIRERLVNVQRSLLSRIASGSVIASAPGQAEGSHRDEYLKGTARRATRAQLSQRSCGDDDHRSLGSTA